MGVDVRDFIDTVRQRAQIEELAGAVTQLSSGSRPTGLCPFHSEDGPSFTVYPEEGRWKCFGCNKGGSVFDFIMEREQIDFWGAVLWLAEHYRIPVPEFGQKDQAKVEREQGVRTFLKRYVEASHRELVGGKHPEALAYLMERGILEESIEQYQLGVGIGIRKAELRKQAIEAGLIVVKDGREHELMKGRLLFPIVHHGRIVNVNGRLLPDGIRNGTDGTDKTDGARTGRKRGGPKYISLGNKSGVTPIAPMGIERLRAKVCNVVEGPIDRILLEQAGIAACATISDKFLPDWLRWCGKDTRFILARDCDANEAGQNANDKDGRLLFEHGLQAEVLELPEGHDPASYVQAFGPEAYESLMAGARPYISYWIGRQAEKPTAGALEKILREGYSLIGRVDRGVRGRFVTELAQRYSLPKGDVREGLAAWLKEHGKADQPQGELEIDPGTKNGNADYQYPDPEDDRPIIFADDEDLQRVTGLMWDATRAANRPEKFFRQAGWPVRLVGDDYGRLKVQAFNVDIARHELTKIISWREIRHGKGGMTFEVLKIPRDCYFRTFLASAYVPLPILEQISEVPVFGLDGSLQTAPGYHEASRNYYMPVEGLDIPPVSDDPSDEELDRALTAFNDVVHDFPFTNEADKCHAFCLWLLPYVRGLIRGPTPLHLIEAPKAGTGKSLLMDALLTPSIGTHMGSMPQWGDEDELRKRLTALFIEGHRAVLFDNINNMVNSGTLSMALVQPIWKDRVLGRSGTVEIPISVIWVMTANNPSFSTEMTRRTVPIRMNAGTIDPWERENQQGAFRIPNLPMHVRQNRATLVWAALTVIARWVARGMPAHSGRTLASFTAWANTMGGICEAVGMPGFLENIRELFERSDEEATEWRVFVRVWWEHFGHHQVGAKELLDVARETDCFGIGTSKAGKDGDARSLGRRIKRQRDVVIGILDDDDQPVQFVIRMGQQCRRAYQYYLERVGDDPTPGEGTPFVPSLGIDEEEDVFAEED